MNCGNFGIPSRVSDAGPDSSEPPAEFSDLAIFAIDEIRWALETRRRDKAAAAKLQIEHLETAVEHAQAALALLRGAK